MYSAVPEISVTLVDGIENTGRFLVMTPSRQAENGRGPPRAARDPEGSRSTSITLWLLKSRCTTPGAMCGRQCRRHLAGERQEARP